MAANSRLTVAVHVLVWMALVHRRGRELVTSEQAAESVNTNPVVIRRCLGGLRDAGLVEVRHGAGAGWRLARDPGEITLLEVLQAVEDEPLFGLHRNAPNPKCPVGAGIRPALRQAYDEAEDAARSALGRTTIEDMLRETLAAPST
ncbi:Rrf2 family transcriptional regulator (plasmid) [Streptomyces nigrescens]|uniref:Rrf2 family transcriptional regulator n=2 Tax=Streptomyces TaxID=1883 RepID=A0ABM8A6S4_STRNI|nr:Rrf2 family transcriptional regulator [Streptomyces nigrescens]MEE4418929.1 Rrf2 family transcriptional regulator [Streptomyces sp. DSM 41528]BDM74365.1 Rrf2 family transcriptional regulator [Streptomyces nigrescens]